MRADDFFDEEQWGPVDPWGAPSARLVFNQELVSSLRTGPPDGHDDLDVAVGLTRLIHDELEVFGTGGGERLTNEQMGLALRAEHSVLTRVGIPFDVPWRDLNTFKSHWIRKGCANSYQARRDLLEGYFGPIHLRLIQLEDRVLSGLATPVTPAKGTGWAEVDEEIEELKRRFRTAETVQDYRAVGTHCVGVLEALSRVVYDPTKHLRGDEVEPAVDKTKQRIGRFVEDAVPGRENAEIRNLATKVIEAAQMVKHRHTGTRRDAGIAADSVILLANIARRLGDAG